MAGLAETFYGLGPERRFFEPQPGSGALASTVAPVVGQSSAFRPALALDSDSVAQPAVTEPHPNPSLAAMAQSLMTGLGIVTGGPLGFANALAGLAISNARNVDPSFNGRAQIGELISQAIQSGLSRDRATVEAPENTGAKTGYSGLAAGPADKNSDLGGSKGDYGADSKGIGDVNDSVSDPGKDAPGPDNQSKGDEYRGGGLIQLAGGGKIAKGLGGGLDDLIPTNIDGRRAARLSDGEFVMPADVVSMLGDGSSDAGSRRLYELVKSIRQTKTGREEQAGPIQFDQMLRRILA